MRLGEICAEDIQEGNALVIQMPTDSFTPEALNNLHSLVAAKGRLIRKALGVDLLPVQVEADTVSFPWFSNEATAEEVIQVSGDRVVIGLDGKTTAAMNIKDLTLA